VVYSAAVKRSALLAALVALPAAAQTKVGVIPFVALSGEIPAKTGAKAAAMLANELKNLEGVQSVDVPLEVKPDPSEAALDDAHAAAKEAQDFEKRRKFGQAADAYTKAIAKFDAAAARLDNVNDLADATASLASVLYRMGDDVGGERQLAQAVALAPARDFPGMSTSPLFTATVKKMRDKVLAAQRGTVRIESIPVGSPARLDGQTIGRTPVVIKDVPAGDHLWRVDLPTGEQVGGSLSVKGGSTAKVAGVESSAGNQGQLALALLKNKLDAGGVGLVKSIAGSSGADLLVFGTLYLSGKDMLFDSFLYSPSKDTLVRLPRNQFDPDLLNAGLELFKLAGEVGAKGLEAGKPAKLPTTVCADTPPPEAATVADARYAMPGEATEGETAVDTGPRKPVTRKPLSRKPVKHESDSP
jgi:hypothetical protein